MLMAACSSDTTEPGPVEATRIAPVLPPLGVEPEVGLTEGERSLAARAAHIASVQAGASSDYALAPGRMEGSVIGASPVQGWRLALRAGVLELARSAAPEVPMLELRCRGIGRGSSLEPLSEAAEMVLDRNRVSYGRGGLVEQWYVNGPLGVEHGFVLSERPDEGVAAEALTIEMAYSEGATARLDAARGRVVLCAAEGSPCVRYGELYAHDALGRALESSLELRAGSIRLRIDDRGAHYPLFVDPLLWAEEQKLLASDCSETRGFGQSVAISGDVALVGAFGHYDWQPEYPGSAYVFLRANGQWTQEQKLVAPDGNPYDAFGLSVSISDETAIVGAANNNGLFDTPPHSHPCSAYVFVRSGGVWSLEQQLLRPDSSECAEFGVAVAVSGDTAIVGASYDDEGAPWAGSAYVFVRSAGVWTLEQKLLASDGAAYDFFGRSVALSGNTAIVGAHSDEDDSAGSAYVFVRSGGVWTEQQKLLPEGGTEWGEFGSSVCVLDDTAIVGDPNDFECATGAGAAYVFARSSGVWTLEQKLFRPDCGQVHGFGSSVSLSAETALVGSDAVPYMFVRVGGVWTLKQSLSPWNPVSGIAFGQRVALSTNAAFVTASSALDCGWDSGSAYVFAPGWVDQVDDGEPCTIGIECVSGFCSDGVCCDEACGHDDPGDCRACSVSAGAATDGVCGPSTGGACDDGHYCTANDICQAGACVGTGDPCPGPDGDGDCRESCNEALRLCEDNDPDGAPCPGGSCQQGICEGSGGAAGSGGTGGSDTGSTSTETATGGSTARAPLDVTAVGGCRCGMVETRAPFPAWPITSLLALALGRRCRRPAPRKQPACGRLPGTGRGGRRHQQQRESPWAPCPDGSAGLARSSVGGSQSPGGGTRERTTVRLRNETGAHGHPDGPSRAAGPGVHRTRKEELRLVGAPGSG